MKYYWAYYQIIIVIYNNILVPQICKKKKNVRNFTWWCIEQDWKLNLAGFKSLYYFSHLQMGLPSELYFQENL